jgi:hypothetical protein
MFSKISLAFLVSGLIISGGCKKANDYPDEPVLSFKSLTTQKESGIDRNLTLVVSFTDGDGDVGWEDSNPQDNFILKWFKFTGSSWVELIPVSSFNSTIHPLTPSGKNKAIRGDISFFTEFLVSPAAEDTFRLEVYIVDRAMHQSNTVTTPQFILNTP